MRERQARSDRRWLTQATRRDPPSHHHLLLHHIVLSVERQGCGGLCPNAGAKEKASFKALHAALSTPRQTIREEKGLK